MDAVFNSRLWTRLKLRGSVPAERAELGVTFAIVALGIWFRARGYLFSTEALWLDEAGWARHLIEEPVAAQLIRPLAFMAFTKMLVWLFGAWEAVLRALPWAAGVATTLVAPILARRLFQSAAARLLFVAILALDPAAIDLSKEFKPYSVSLALHAALVLTTLAYRDSRRTRDLAWVLALAVPGVLFAQDAVFAYPGVFVVLSIDALQGKKWRHLAAIATLAMATLGVIGSLYFFVWSKLDRSGEETFWGKKYHVFFVPPKTGPGDQVSWLSSRYAELTETAGERNAKWSSEHWTKTTVGNLEAVDNLVWLTLHLAGLTVIVRGRRLREGLLLVMPLAVMLVFNVMGVWPFGVFRANLFTLLYVAGIAAIALDRKPTRTRLWDFLPAFLLVLLPLVMFEHAWHRAKGADSDMSMTSRFPEAIRAAILLQGPTYGGRPEPLISDNYGCAPWRFYVDHHPTMKKLAPELGRRFDFRCRRLAPEMLREAHQELKERGGRVWLLATDPIAIHDLDRKWPSDLVKTKTRRIGETTHLVLGVTRVSAAEGQPEEP